MTDTDIEEIGDWFRIEVQYDEFQHEMWRNGATGEVLVVEEQDQPWADDDNINVLLLPENFQDDPTPTETIAQGIGDVEDALGRAREWMEG